MPTTERSLASTTMSQPAARIAGPPAPKNSHEGSRRRMASISWAPYISPEASPAEIRIRTRHCKLLRLVGSFSHCASRLPREQGRISYQGELYWISNGRYAAENLLPRNLRLPDECARLRESRRHAGFAGIFAGSHGRRSWVGSLQYVLDPG